MNAKKSILFISNGLAEDTVVLSIIEELERRTKSLNISVMPVVGDAFHFRKINCKVIGPHKELPSGGILFKDLNDILRDLKAGLLFLILGQVIALYKSRKSFDLVVGVGDEGSVILNGLFVKKPFFYVGVTSTGLRHTQTLLKKHCIIAFPRDKRMEEDLKRLGLKVRYRGNPLMDTIKISGIDLGIEEGVIPIGVLPGSREDAYKNIPLLLEVFEIAANLLKPERILFLVAPGPRIDLKRFLDICIAKDWKIFKTGKEKGLVAEIFYDEVKAKIFSQLLGDVINKARIVISLGGTGSELSVGAGRPVITFALGNSRAKREFIYNHKVNILKDSAIMAERDADIIAQEIRKLLFNPHKMEEMGRVGRNIMGAGGATSEITAEIINYLAA